MNKVHKLQLYIASAFLFGMILAAGIGLRLTAKQPLETVYMICDVYDVATNGNNVYVDIVLPNGELLTCQMSVDDDLPEEFSEVIIQTDDLDNYRTYKIVGMR